MRYNEKYYVCERNKNFLLEVKGCTYQKDNRLFIHKGDKNVFILSEKATGLYIVTGKTLNELESRFEAKKELYHKAIVGDVYKKAKSVYNELLQSGSIATIKGV